MKDDAFTRGLIAAVRTNWSGKPTLYWTLRNNHEAIIEAFGGRKRRNWSGLANYLTDSKLFKTKDGGPIKPETIRRTFIKVEEDLAAERATIALRAERGRSPAAGPTRVVFPARERPRVSFSPTRVKS